MEEPLVHIVWPLALIRKQENPRPSRHPARKGPEPDYQSCTEPSSRRRWGGSLPEWG